MEKCSAELTRRMNATSSRERLAARKCGLFAITRAVFREEKHCACSCLLTLRRFGHSITGKLSGIQEQSRPVCRNCIRSICLRLISPSARQLSGRSTGTPQMATKAAILEQKLSSLPAINRHYLRSVSTPEFLTNQLVNSRLLFRNREDRQNAGRVWRPLAYWRLWQQRYRKGRPQ
jgi:hypothetical protein